jgi:hypothetical protein
LRDEFLNGEIFYSMKQLRLLASRSRVHFNTSRPRAELGHKPRAVGVAEFNKQGAWKCAKPNALPLSHAPDYGGEINQSLTALHQVFHWHKLPGRGGEFNPSVASLQRADTLPD